MGITPDRFPGTSDEEELLLEDRTADGDPTQEGAIRYLNGDFRAKNATGVVSLTTGSGLNPATHRTLDQLIHEIAEDNHTEYSYSGSRLDSMVVWTDVTKTKKIREEQYTYTGSKVTTIVTTQYDGDGNPVEVYTETYSYTGNRVTSVTGVLS